MSPTHQVAKDIAHNEWLSKMRRSSYSWWKQRIAEAKDRSDRLRDNAFAAWKRQE